MIEIYYYGFSWYIIMMDDDQHAIRDNSFSVSSETSGFMYAPTKLCGYLK